MIVFSIHCLKNISGGLQTFRLSCTYSVLRGCFLKRDPMILHVRRCCSFLWLTKVRLSNMRFTGNSHHQENRKKKLKVSARGESLCKIWCMHHYSQTSFLNFFLTHFLSLKWKQCDNVQYDRPVTRYRLRYNRERVHGTANTLSPLPVLYGLRDGIGYRFIELITESQIGSQT